MARLPSEIVDKWDKMAKEAGWESDPVGLWVMMLREYHRFIMHHIR